MADRPAEITGDQWTALRSLYRCRFYVLMICRVPFYKCSVPIFRSPEDIDLYSAGQAETPVPGGLTGPIFNCIKAKQFKSLMDGDRFFFTHKDQVGSFTTDQMVEIKKRWLDLTLPFNHEFRRLSDILCDNTDIANIQDQVFLAVSPTNQRRPCSISRQINVQKFV